jgi:hypothetical protein
LIQVEISFCVVAVAMSALGILSIASVIRGGVALGVFALVVAAGLFAIAGYFLWAYRWVNRHPDRLRQAEGEKVMRSRLQRAPDEPTLDRDADSGLWLVVRLPDLSDRRSPGHIGGT